MTMRFTVLASGSAGNAALVEVNGFGLLIDCGIGPRSMSARLRSIGATWANVHAVMLTHTHGDHWKDLCFNTLQSNRIPLYAHRAQLNHLSVVAPSFDSLHKASLTRSYAGQQQVELTRGLSCIPIEVSHDSNPTFAFRIDYREAGGSELTWSIGYASDLGCASKELVEGFAGVDVLAIEFNHDEKMERASPRPVHLVQRVLGDEGHLSNGQAAELTRAIAAGSGPSFPHHLVQLHLSKDCNHPHLAEAAGRNALADLNPAASVIVARQDIPSRSIPLVRHSEAAHRLATRPSLAAVPQFKPMHPQPVLPGFESA